MLRVARRALIFLERHRFELGGKDPHGLGVYSRGLWVRDYAALLKQFVPEGKIRIAKIPEEIWPGWKYVGTVIEVVVG